MKEIGSTLGLSESRVSKMHSSIVNRLKEQLHRRQPEFAERIINLGGQLAKPNTPEEFVAFIELEIERWGKIIRAANVRLE